MSALSRQQSCRKAANRWGVGTGFDPPVHHGLVATLVGLDLAWTRRRPTGICVIEASESGAAVVRIESRRIPIMTPLVRELLGLEPPVIVAVDAPLIVGPERTAERAVGSVFGRYGAAAHSANHRLLRTTGRRAGPRLGRIAALAGFELDPGAVVAGRRRERTMFETYPHALFVTWFRLGYRLPYKRKTRRSLATVHEALRMCQEGLEARLAEHRIGTGPAGALLRADQVTGTGRTLKALEDRLDALSCALAAFDVWRDGLTTDEVLGSAGLGQVVVPGLRFGLAPSTSGRERACP